MNSGTPLINTAYKDKDLELWNKWKSTKSPYDLQALVNRFDSVIHNMVNKLSGSTVSKDVLLTKAKILAVNAFNSYDPNRGVALATHVTNNLAPLHRVIYTYQNTARLPENITLKLNQYNVAKDHLISSLGREPTVDELHSELGWSTKELGKMELYQRKDLIESVGETGDAFGTEEADDDLLAAIYYDLAPQEKKLFEYTTGYGSYRRSNEEIMRLLGWNQSQLSYQKRLLTNKIKSLIDKSRYKNRAANALSTRPQSSYSME